MTNTNFVSINPATQKDTAEIGQTSFAALIHVKSSRYVERTYQDPSLASKVAIKWEMGTTKGNTFDRMWTTGILWEGGKNVSPDGKKLTQPIAPRSDAGYLLRKVVTSGFPTEKIVDDVSVFEGQTFFMTEDANPGTRGSYKGLYPKQYHPEGWDAALAETLARRAAREAQQNAPAYNAGTTLQSSYTPPAVMQQSNADVLKAAGDALVGILQTNGSTIERNKIPAKLNTYVETTGKAWEQKFRQNVAIALWDMDTLKTVVGNNPALKIENETVSFK